MQQDSQRGLFQRLADDLIAELRGDEVLICTFAGEDSDFVRLNRGEVRQAGSVAQRSFSLDLIDGGRHAVASTTLRGDPDRDLAWLKKLLGDLRERLPLVPEDPYLNYATEVRSTERRADHEGPAPETALADIREASAGRDLVGIYASGGIYGGLANSLGQRNWYETSNFNFDWCFYHSGDKAVKTTYAGLEWDPAALRQKVDLASHQLAALAHDPVTIPPGRYRVYLTPAAVRDVLAVLSWGGFGLKALRTRQSPLLKLSTGEETLHEAVTLLENTGEGVGPDFQGQGFHRPPSVPLIRGGRHAEALVSPRSAKEYQVETNGASGAEAPESLDLAPGSLAHDDVLARLDDGIYVGNVWYLNYSDRSACRTTGMTRFATFRVQNGEIQAPLNVMRFDETVYRMLGENLVDLTAERELVLDPGSWSRRSTTSARVPGALIEDFNLTL